MDRRSKEMSNHVGNDTSVREPLERRIIESAINGETRKLPALNRGWVKPIPFALYQPPPIPRTHNYEATKDEWMERMQCIRDDLKWLLSLPHYKFWCQVLYHRPTRLCLESFLRNSPRPCDIHDFLVSSDMHEIHSEVDMLVLKTYLRMSTCRESRDNHITPGFFGELIYDFFLFDSLLIMDLCVLYGKSNRPLLNKMIENIFKNQPNYYKDMKDAAGAFIVVLDDIETQLGLAEKSGRIVKGHVKDLKDLSWHSLQELVMLMVDTACTIDSLFQVYEPSCDIFHQVGFAPRIATFYDVVLPPLLKELKRRKGDESVSLLAEEVLDRLNMGRAAMLRLVRCIVERCCIRPVLESNGAIGKRNEQADFCEVFTALISEKRFIYDYENRYPLEDDLSLFSQLACQQDSMRILYIQNGIKDAFHSLGKEFKRREAKDASASNSTECNGTVDDSMLGACASPLNTLEVQAKRLTDMIPGTGAGFMALCLEYFNYSVETVLNAYFECNLPPYLADADRMMKLEEVPEFRKKMHLSEAGDAYERSEPPVEEASTSKKKQPDPNAWVPNADSILNARHNVFDYDEFDVFNNPYVDKEKIIKGKKDVAKDAKSLLEGRRDSDNVRQLYEMHGSVEEWDQYDDEYDDTYDGLVVAEEPTTADEMLVRRPFVTPRILQQAAKEQEEDEEESAEEGEAEAAASIGATKPKYQLYEDPAKLRERAEQRRQQRAESRGGGGRGSRNRGPPQPPPSQRDVVGKPKGQGQETDVVRNRTNKEQHKGQRANHNRKNLSDRKNRV